MTCKYSFGNFEASGSGTSILSALGGLAGSFRVWGFIHDVHSWVFRWSKEFVGGDIGMFP